LSSSKLSSTPCLIGRTASGLSKAAGPFEERVQQTAPPMADALAPAAVSATVPVWIAWIFIVHLSPGIGVLPAGGPRRRDAAQDQLDDAVGEPITWVLAVPLERDRMSRSAAPLCRRRRAADEPRPANVVDVRLPARDARARSAGRTRVRPRRAGCLDSGRLRAAGARTSLPLAAAPRRDRLHDAFGTLRAGALRGRPRRDRAGGVRGRRGGRPLAADRLCRPGTSAASSG
jgi:hypothetical protein